MTPSATLASLITRGITLAVDSDRLRVRGSGAPLPDNVREGLREHRALVIALHSGPPAAPSVTLWVLNAGRVGGPVVYLPPTVAAYGTARGLPYERGEDPGAYVGRLRAALLPADVAADNSDTKG